MKKKEHRTAIGQTEDGSILMLIVDGNNNGSGATLSEVLNVMKTYGAVNAANLSGGKQTIMWWNGRIVNVPYYDPIGGVRLPTAWVAETENNKRNGNMVDLYIVDVFYKYLIQKRYLERYGMIYLKKRQLY